MSRNHVDAVARWTRATTQRGGTLLPGLCSPLLSSRSSDLARPGGGIQVAPHESIRCPLDEPCDRTAAEIPTLAEHLERNTSGRREELLDVPSFSLNRPGISSLSLAQWLGASHHKPPALPRVPGTTDPIARKHFQLPSGSFFNTMSTVPRICFASPPGESTKEPV